ncbi:unnamed protein product [Mytilus edulis]|uniref:B box-type domain-containing protein n=1 Tax=Mytilus edulis TaxID=6550 RepID=A0A8S3TKL8_MYTED|nr:unnamed protein product [Mytilus edulis]
MKWNVNLVIGWKKKNSADQWCVSCHERLCLECSSYHRALTATKDHSLISIKQYEAILPILKSVEIKCVHHTENDLEYVCKEHECFCCIKCKRETHVDCRKVEKIEEIISETDLTSELKHMKNRVGSCIDKESGSVKFTKTIEFDRDHCDFDLQSLPMENEHEETASSTVEAEEMVPLDESQKKAELPNYLIL